MEPTVDTAIIAASTRTPSINAALARAIAEHGRKRGDVVDLIDLREFEMPMYHGDLEERDGVPAAAVELAERMATARRLVIASPEYNGSFPALLKNTIDWLTRVDRGVLSHLDVHLAAASPGARGGIRGLAHLETWLTNMRLTVVSPTLSVPSASVDDAGRIVSPEPLDLDGFLPETVSGSATGRQVAVRN